MIIGILAGVAIPQYKKAIAKSKITQALVLGKAIKDAEERYYTDNGAYTTDLEALLLNIGEYEVIVDSQIFLNFRLKSNKYRVEIAINAYGGANDRVEVYIPFGSSYQGISYYFNHDSGRKQKGRHCFGDTETFKSVCKQMGGIEVGTNGYTTCIDYQLP